MNRFTGVGIIVMLLFAGSCAVIPSSQTDSEGEMIVGKIGNDSVTLKELKTQYYKSNALLPEEEQDLAEFLELYMDYRLKLTVAGDAGYLEDPDILSELEEFERQLAFPFWLEHHIRESLVDELYERSMEQIHAQHILIEVPDQATPDDTLKAWNTLLEAREEFLGGDQDFLALAQQYSSRRRGQSMGGDLGYFSAGWAVKPFEDAAYALNKGEVSKPFRSPFGYHIVYVKDRIGTGPEKKFSHIFFTTRGITDPVDSVLAKAGAAYAELQSGKPWNSVVESYSEDEQSRLSGGDIGWIQRGMFDQAFTETLMNIENTEDYTQPFESSYGVHIVRLDSIRQPSEQEIRGNLAEILRQLPRYRENEQAVLDNAASMGNARFHRDNLAAFEDFARKNYRGDFSAILFPDSILERPVFSFHDKSWSGADYLEWIKPVIANQSNPQYHHSLADKFRNHVVDSELIAVTRDLFPEFRDQSRDYLAGLAVFKVNEDSLWHYAQTDTLRLRKIFEENEDKYYNAKRYRFVRFSAQNDSTLDLVRRMVSGGTPVDSIRNEFNNVLIRRDVIQMTDHPPYSYLDELDEDEFSPYFEYQQRQTMLYLEKILKAGPMTFEEAFNKLVTEYQSIREEEWLQEMREKYQVEIRPEVLYPTIADKND